MKTVLIANVFSHEVWTVLPMTSSKVTVTSSKVTVTLATFVCWSLCNKQLGVDSDYVFWACAF